jgi:hypothetical protein
MTGAAHMRSAKRVIKFAKIGERNPDLLCEAS